MTSPRFAVDELVAKFVKHPTRQFAQVPLQMRARGSPILVQAVPAVLLQTTFDVPGQVRCRLPKESRDETIIGRAFMQVGINVPALRQVQRNA